MIFYKNIALGLHQPKLAQNKTGNDGVSPQQFSSIFSSVELTPEQCQMVMDFVHRTIIGGSPGDLSLKAAIPEGRGDFFSVSDPAFDIQKSPVAVHVSRVVSVQTSDRGLGVTFNQAQFTPIDGEMDDFFQNDVEKCLRSRIDSFKIESFSVAGRYRYPSLGTDPLTSTDELCNYQSIKIGFVKNISFPDIRVFVPQYFFKFPELMEVSCYEQYDVHPYVLKAQQQTELFQKRFRLYTPSDSALEQMFSDEMKKYPSSGGIEAFKSNVNKKIEKKFHEMAFSFLIAFAQRTPSFSNESLSICVDILTTAYCNDDDCDSTVSTEQFKSKKELENQLLIQVFLGHSVDTSNVSKRVSALKDCYDRLIEFLVQKKWKSEGNHMALSQDHRDHLLRLVDLDLSTVRASWSEYLDATIWELDNRVKGRTPTRFVYDAMRMYTGAYYFFCDLAYLIIGNPHFRVKDPYSITLNQSVARMIGNLNDLIFKKEAEEGKSKENKVFIYLEEDYGVSIQDIKPNQVNFLKDAVDKVVKDLAKSSLELVQQLISIVSDRGTWDITQRECFVTSILWYTSCVRFHGLIAHDDKIVGSGRYTADGKAHFERYETVLASSLSDHY